MVQQAFDVGGETDLSVKAFRNGATAPDDDGILTADEINNLQADAEQFDTTYLARRRDWRIGGAVSSPTPFPLQAIPRMAFVINYNMVYDEDEGKWVPKKKGEVLETFAEGNIAEYSGDTTEPTVVTERAFDEEHSLKWKSSGQNDGTIDTQDIQVSRPAKLAYNLYLDGGGDAGFLFAVQSSPSGYKSGSKYIVSARQKTSDGLFLRRYDNGSFTQLASAGFDPPFNEWFRVSIDWRADGVIEVEASQKGKLVSSRISVKDTTYSGGGIGWRSDDPNFVKYYDFLTEGF